MEWWAWLVIAVVVLIVVGVSALVTQAWRRRGGVIADKRHLPRDGDER